MKNKICVITGSRAEYGLLRPLLLQIPKTPTFHLQVAVTGMHLSSEYGSTYKEIIQDGFKIDEKVKVPLNDDTSEGITRSIARGMEGFAAAFKRLKPDIVVLLGDRSEIFAAALAAFLERIPIIHLHGGELTEGAMDDAFRHAITKMSILHFTSTEAYRQRVIQLGEAPKRVFNVGALGVENIKNLKLLSKKELEVKLNFTLNGKTVLVTFHPVTLENNTARKQIEELLSALKKFKGLKVVFTKSNSDINGKIINKTIDEYVRKNKGEAVAFASLGVLKYLSLMKFVDVVLGNSSSGIIETPSFGKPTINIGDRQKGRIAAQSVIQCDPQERSIVRALHKAFSVEFRSACSKVKNPYDNGSTSQKIISIIKKETPKIKDLKKEFYDSK